MRMTIDWLVRCINCHILLRAKYKIITRYEGLADSSSIIITGYEKYNRCSGLDVHITAHCVPFNFSTRRERYDRILHPSGLVIVRLTIKEGTRQYSRLHRQHNSGPGPGHSSVTGLMNCQVK